MLRSEYDIEPIGTFSTLANEMMIRVLEAPCLDPKKMDATIASFRHEAKQVEKRGQSALEKLDLSDLSAKEFHREEDMRDYIRYLAATKFTRAAMKGLMREVAKETEKDPNIVFTVDITNKLSQKSFGTLYSLVLSDWTLGNKTARKKFSSAARAEFAKNILGLAYCSVTDPRDWMGVQEKIAVSERDDKYIVTVPAVVFKKVYETEKAIGSLQDSPGL